jgi:hypothetical protein
MKSKYTNMHNKTVANILMDLCTLCTANTVATHAPNNTLIHVIQHNNSSFHQTFTNPPTPHALIAYVIQCASHLWPYIFLIAHNEAIKTFIKPHFKEGGFGRKLSFSCLYMYLQFARQMIVASIFGHGLNFESSSDLNGPCIAPVDRSLSNPRKSTIIILSTRTQ